MRQYNISSDRQKQKLRSISKAKLWMMNSVFCRANYMGKNHCAYRTGITLFRVCTPNIRIRSHQIVCNVGSGGSAYFGVQNSNVAVISILE